MGNCIVKKSSVQWGGEDWGACGLGSRSNFSGDKARNPEDSCAESTDVMSLMTETTSLLGEDKGVSSSLPKAGTKVKIRISKKQLEQLLKNINADVQGLSAQEVLVQLANASDRFEAHRRSWAPSLQNIPE